MLAVGDAQWESGSALICMNLSKSVTPSVVVFIIYTHTGNTYITGFSGHRGQPVLCAVKEKIIEGRRKWGYFLYDVQGLTLSTIFFYFTTVVCQF